MNIIAEVSELTRKIKLPNDRVMSVNGDYQVDSISFKLPDTYGGDFDFSTGAARVHWTGVDGVDHTNLLAGTDTNGYPLWTMPSELTQGGAGVIEFAVSFTLTDANEAVTKKWKSDPVSFRNRNTVGGSNEDEEAEEEGIYDQLAGLLNAVRTAQESVDDVAEVLSSLGTLTFHFVGAKADMTDQTKLYVLTTDGYLYYYSTADSDFVPALEVGGAQEVIDARTDENGTTHANLKARIDAGFTQVNEDLNDLELRVEDIEQGGTGGLSMTAVNLLNTILSEAVYGTDQTANIALLHNELSNVAPVSISAVLNGTALEGQSYSELSFTVTATFDDESTQTVPNYTIVTTGTVAAGSNTVTIRYRGLITTCTFTAEDVTTYTITNNLTNVTNSNAATVVVENSYYSATLTADTDYEFAGCTVTMGGVDVTATVYSNQEILITEVTGDVVITATAEAISYLDPLIFNRSGYMVIYSDNFTTQVASIGSGAAASAMTEYPALNECTIYYTLTNNTESAISLTNVGLGSVPAYDSSRIASLSNGWNSIGYWRAITNSSGILEAGESLSGSVTLRAGHQLAFTVVNAATLNSLTLTLSGAYVADEFAGYSTLTLDGSSANYGSYRGISYYSDDGSTLIKSGNGTPKLLSDSVAAGTYDVQYILRDGTGDTGSYQELIAGAVESNSDNDSYYACGTTKYLIPNMWYHGQLTVGADDVALISASAIFTSGNYVDIRIKEVE